MKTKATWLAALWFVGLGTLAIPSCTKQEPQPPTSTGDNAAAEKAAADKAAAEKAAAEKEAAIKAAEAKAGAEAKAAAEKAAAEKTAAEKTAAEKAAALQKAEAAALPADLVVMKSEIARALSQIDLTMAKLESLASSTGDLDKPSQDAIDAIAALDTETQAVKKRADEMRSRGAAYFEAWEKQLAAMSTPEVVALATARKNELSAKYAEVLTAMQESRAAFDPFWADLQAIHKVIEDGVTPETQKSLAAQIKAVKARATTLKSRVEDTSAKLNQVGAIYTRA